MSTWNLNEITISLSDKFSRINSWIPCINFASLYEFRRYHFRFNKYSIRISEAFHVILDEFVIGFTKKLLRNVK